ncbi:MAG: O-methyltransferase, partial [Armatimonadota bacterium]
RPEPPPSPPRDMGAPPMGMFGGPGRGPGRDFGSTYVGEPLAKNDAEKKILDTMANMVGGRNLQNVPMGDGRLLRVLTEAVGAKNVVEIGTSNGYSALWISMALKSTGGKLTTFEIDPERVRMARENFRRAGVDQIVTVVEGDAHEQVTKLKDPIDLLFIDADKEGYADYLKKLLPLVRPGGLILAHNFDMLGQDYVRAVTTNPNLETIYLPSSFGVTLKKR